MEIPAALRQNPITGRLVEIAGMVQTVRTNYVATSIRHNRVTLVLRHDHRVIPVIAPQPNRTNARRINLAHIRARGILFDVYEKNDVVQRVLWATSWNDIEFERDGPENPFDRDVHSLQSVAEGNVDSGDEPIRLRARVLNAMDSQSFRVGRDLGSDSPTFLVRQDPVKPLFTGDVMDMIGFPLPGEDSNQFEMTSLRWLGLPGDVRAREGTWPGLSEYMPVAGNGRVLRALKVEQLDRQWPFRMPGTVTYRDESQGVFYLQKRAGKGVKVHWVGTNSLPLTGAGILLRGHAVHGARVPKVIGRELLPARKLGQIPALTAGPATFLAGRYSGKLVTLNGIVHSVRLLTNGHLEIRFAWMGNIVKAVLQQHEGELPRHLVDAWVILQGISEARRESPQALPDEVLLIEDLDQIKVVEPAHKNPFERRRWDLTEVREHVWLDPEVHRIKVRGTVTFVHGRRLFLQDSDGAIEALTMEDTDVIPGDVVTAIGFPTPGRIGPYLDSSILHKWHHAEPPPAMNIAAADALTRDIDGRRIRTRGTVIGHSQVSGRRLEMRDADRIFTVRLPGSIDAEALQLDSVLDVTGICQYYSGGPLEPESFRVILAGPEDVVVVGFPPWWTPARTLAASGGTLILALAALGWAAFFRNRARKHHRQFVTTFNASPKPAWIVRRSDLECIEVNHEFERRFACPREEFVGHRLSEVQLCPPREIATTSSEESAKKRRSKRWRADCNAVREVPSMACSPLNRSRSKVRPAS